jgi:hypothetical protein
MIEVYQGKGLHLGTLLLEENIRGSFFVTLVVVPTQAGIQLYFWDPDIKGVTEGKAQNHLKRSIFEAPPS